LDPRFAGSDIAEDDGFLRAIKVCSKPSIGGEIKPSIPCLKIPDMLKIPSKYEQRYFLGPNSFPSPVPPASR
jgi:hypothetical protein